MSYHNNNNGYNSRGGGGFRNNYNSNYNNNQGGFNGGGFHGHNGQRINELQVPQSKHTIFIRGLHGDTTTEEIADYIGEKVGKVSFDFVKQAQDGSKMFVAVRFEKREEAKEFMETYQNREFMGARCELSWFRDIRRYCAYQRSKMLRSNSQRRRRRSDSEEEDSKRSESPPARRRKSRSRSRSRSRDRSQSSNRSASRHSSPIVKRESRTRTRSESKNSNASRSSSSGRSRSSRRSRSSGKESSRVSSRNQSRDENNRKSRNSPDDSGRRRRRDSSVSNKNQEKDVPKKKKNDQLPQIPLPPTKKKSPSPAFIPPPSTAEMEMESPPQHVDAYHGTYSVSMEEETTPKIVVKTEEYYPTVPMGQIYQAPPQSYVPTPVAPPPAPPVVSPVVPPVPAPLPPPSQPVALPTAPSPLPPPPPPFLPRSIGKIEILMPSSLPAVATPPPQVAAQVTPPSAAAAPMLNGSAAVMAGTDNALFPTTHKLFGHLKAFQSALVSTVKFEKKEEETGEFSSLRLSTMNNGEEEGDTEEMKALEREQKLAKLNDEQMMRFHIKKKQLETAFRNDCETYAVVTRALLSKDESLQFGLKMSLLENMEDLYKKMMQRVDDQLDVILLN